MHWKPKAVNFFFIAAIVAGLAGCGGSADNPEAVATEATEMPPGFLDPAPPPPTSDTLILSGGTLVVMNEDGASTIADSVVVVQGTKLVAYGVRGEVDVPNDSIGRDFRGKWLIPGSPTEAIPSTAGLNIGEDLSLVIVDQPPMGGSVDPATIVGRLADGELKMSD